MVTVLARSFRYTKSINSFSPTQLWISMLLLVGLNSACGAELSSGTEESSDAQNSLPPGCIAYDPADESVFPKSLWREYLGAETPDLGYERRLRQAAQALQVELWDYSGQITGARVENALRNAFCNLASPAQLDAADDPGFPLHHQMQDANNSELALTDEDRQAWKLLNDYFRKRPDASKHDLQPLWYAPPTDNELEFLKYLIEDLEAEPSVVLDYSASSGHQLAEYHPISVQSHPQAAELMAELIMRAKQGPSFEEDWHRFGIATIAEIAYLGANWQPFGALGSNWAVMFILVSQAHSARYGSPAFNRRPKRPSTGLDALMKWVAMTPADAEYLYEGWSKGQFDALFYSEEATPLRRYGGRIWIPSAGIEERYEQTFWKFFDMPLNRIADLIENTQQTGSATGQEHAVNAKLISIPNRMLSNVLVPDETVTPNVSTVLEELVCYWLGDSPRSMDYYLSKRDQLQNHWNAVAQDTKSGSWERERASYVRHMFGTPLTTFNGYAQQASTYLENKLGCYAQAATYRYLSSTRIFNKQ